MNVFQMERTWMVGAIGVAVCCFFGIVMGLLARRKGYSFLAWFGTGGTLLISALLLAFQPKLRGVELPIEELERSKRRGNGIGWLIAAVNYLLIILASLLPALQNFAALNPRDYFQLYIVPAYQWADWAYVTAMVVILVRFAFMPRGSRSNLLIVVFTVMALNFAWSLVDGNGVRITEEENNWAKVDYMVSVVTKGIGALVFFALAYLATEPRIKTSDEKL